MMYTQFAERRERYRIACMAILLAFSCVLTYYFNAALKTGTVFTHFFYIPIILASLWWKRKGIVVALFLALFLIFSHLSLREDVISFNDYLRAGMFIVISFIVAQLREHSAKTEQESKRSSEARKHVEKALQESEEHYQTIFETTGTATIILEEDMTVSMVNSEFEKIFGYSKEAVEWKRKWTEFIAEDDVDRIRTYHYLRRKDYQAAPRSYEFKFIDQKGVVRHILGTVAVIPGTKKSVVSCLDITERKRAEEELAQTHQALLKSERLTAMGTAAAHVAHEIKNPLMLIGGFAQQVLRALKKDEKAQKKLITIINEVRRLEGFLQDIGRFAKDVKPQKEQLNINESIKEVVAFVEDELAERKIAMHINTSPYPIYVLADPDQLEQVLLNIVKNAIEAMPEGGHLTITTRKNAEALIEIHDTGNGISQEVLDKVFNPFFTTKKTGTGLGLAICHNIIIAHEGTITIKSKGEGKGVKVTIRLPLLVDA